MIRPSPNNAFLLRMLGMSLLRRRSRMAVALVGIAVGATALLGMASLCFDIPRQMSREFRSYGANMVFVSAAGARLRLDDAERARAVLPAGRLVGMTPLRYLGLRVDRRPRQAGQFTVSPSAILPSAMVNCVRLFSRHWMQM